MPLFQNPIPIEGTAYFASDFHFGTPTIECSQERELLVIKWLDEIMKDADYLFLLGDIFDFWFEYKDVVPRGYFRFFAKLAELHDKGIKIYYFTGNHDMWVNNYFSQEMGMTVFTKQQPFLINGKKCMVGHGDGLDVKDKGYLFIKKLFAFRPNRMLYASLHPRIAFGIARFFSKSSRNANGKRENQYKSAKIESIIPYILQTAQTENIDCFIYGHRHMPSESTYDNNVKYFNIGDWLSHYSYLRWSPTSVSLQFFKS